MEKRTTQLVKFVFEDIPYSLEVAEAQEKICSALEEKYRELCETVSEGEAIDSILSEYGQLTKMAQLAGYSKEQALAWRNTGDAKELKFTQRLVQKQRRQTYLTSFFSIASIIELVWTMYNAVKFNGEFFFTLLMTMIYVLLSILCIGKIIKTGRENCNEKYDNAAFGYLRTLSDKYTKRLFNSLALFIGAIFVLVGSELSFYVFGNSKSAELRENLFSNIILLEIPLFLLVKNMILHKLIQKQISVPEKKSVRKYEILLIVFSFAYWIGITLFTVIASSKISFPGNIFFAASAVYAFIILVFNLTIRKKVTYKNLIFNPKRFAVVTAVVLFVSGFTALQRDTWYTQSYINSIPVIEHKTYEIEYNEQTGVYTITSSSEDFKILHLTDIHIGGSLYSYDKDMKALKACYAEIKYTQPDLVIVTGDLCFPMGIRVVMK